MRLTRLAITNIVLAAVTAAGGAFAYTSLGRPAAAQSRTVAERTATIGTGTVLTSITSSGNVTAPQNLDINFGASGKITQIRVAVGQQVTQGQELARLDPAAAQAALDAAKAQLAVAQEKLTNPSGTTTLDAQGMAIAAQQAEQQVNAAQTALANAQQNLSLDQTAQAAALAQAQQQLSTDQTGTAAALSQAQQQLAADQATLSQDSASLAQAVTQAQAQAAHQLAIDQAQLTVDNDTWTADGCATTPTTAACDRDYVAIQSDNAKILADGGAGAPATVVVQAQNTQTQTLAKDQAAINKDQDAITNASNAQAATLAKDNQAIKNASNAQAATVAKDNQAIKNAQQQLTNAQLSLQSLQNSNAQKTAAPLPADVESNQAAVEQAQVQVTNAQAALDATTLTAPADGTIGAINASVGDTASAGTTSTTATSSSGSSSGNGSGGSGSGGSGSGGNASSGFITLTNLTDLQVAANIDEADAAKVAVDAPATVTLNALPGKIFAAHVIAVADTSTVSSNVVQYPVTLSIDNTNSTIKPGMTANVTVTTSKIDGVLNVASAAVRSAGGTSYVMVMQPDGTQKRVDVVVGLKGDTATEISGAVKAGQIVALPVSTTSSAPRTQPTQTSNNRGGVGGVGGGGGGLGGGFGGFGGGRG